VTQHVPSEQENEVGSAHERLFRFADFDLDPARFELRRLGNVIPLRRKPLQILIFLALNAPRSVSRDELLRAVWGEVRVSEGSAKAAIHEARRALGDSGSSQRFISTVTGGRYRICVPVYCTGPERAGSDRRTTPGQDCARTSDVFLGRSRELRLLGDALQGALDGERRIALLQGPSGIGKTRLALEIASDAHRHGADVLIARTHPWESGPPQWLWQQLLAEIARRRPLGALQSRSAQAARIVVQLVPELRQHLGSDAHEEIGTFEDAAWIQRVAIADLIQQASRQCPQIILLDDLQWADLGSLRTLAFIARHLQESATLILCTYRPLPDSALERSQLLHEILAQGGTDLVVVPPMPPAAIHEYLEVKLGPRMSPAMTHRIEQASGGNPYFLREITRHLAESDSLEQTDGERVPIPSLVQELVRLRIRNYDDTCQMVLNHASAIGLTFPLQLVARASSLSSETVLNCFSLLERDAWISRCSLPGSYRFAHGLVQEVVYTQLSELESMRIHRSLGEAMLGLGAERNAETATELARHFSLSAPLAGRTRAIRFLELAAEEAMQAYAFDRAADCFRRALELCATRSLGDDELRYDLTFRLGEALCGADRPFHEVARTLQGAGQVAERARREDLRARALVVEIEYAASKGFLAQFGESAALESRRARYAGWLDGLLAGGLLQNHEDLHIRALLVRATLAYDDGDLSRVRACSAQALELARGANLMELETRAHIGRLPALVDLGELQDRAVHINTALELNEKVGSFESAMHLYGARIADAIVVGDRRIFDAAHAQLERIERETCLPRSRWQACCVRGARALLDGQLEDSRREAARAHTAILERHVAAEFSLTIQFFQRWWDAMTCGDSERMIPALELRSLGDAAALYHKLTLAHLYSEAGRFQDASSLIPSLTDALDWVPRHHGWFFWAWLCSESAALRQDARQAEELLERLLPDASRGVAFFWYVFVMGPLARPLATLAGTLRRWKLAEQLFQSSLSYAARMRSPVLHLLTKLDYASVLSLSSDRSSELQRAELLEDAEKLTQDLGLECMMSRARRFGGRR